jgi:hypothetical protein
VKRVKYLAGSSLQKKPQLFPKVSPNGTDTFSKRQFFAGFERKWQGSATLNKNLADLLNALEGS